MGSELSLPLEDLGLIVAAGGSSSRYGQGSKLLADLGGMPVFVWCLRELSKALLPGMAVLSVPESERSLFEDALKWHLPELSVSIVSGGVTRTESVLNALKALPEKAVVAAVHDAARPFVKLETLLECVEACRKHGGSVAAKRVSDTIKEGDAEGFAVRTLNRDSLWAMETPQVLLRRPLQEACERAVASGASFTDDAAALEGVPGVSVKFVESRLFNMKITWPEDLELARSRIPSVASGPAS